MNNARVFRVLRFGLVAVKMTLLGFEVKTSSDLEKYYIQEAPETSVALHERDKSEKLCSIVVSCIVGSYITYFLLQFSISVGHHF